MSCGAVVCSSQLLSISSLYCNHEACISSDISAGLGNVGPPPCVLSCKDVRDCAVALQGGRKVEGAEREIEDAKVVNLIRC